MALRHLSLRDFVIVEQLELDWQDGFTALTGETGAGKSILLDALQLALGARADAIAVREGAPRCEVAAEFDTPAHLGAWLDDNGFTADATLLLRRTVDAGGKSRAWINGSPATATQLRELAEALVDIHGQHAWQSLTRPAATRALLDAYAALDTAPLARLWHAWRAAARQLDEAQAAQHTLAQERERLQWQIGEVEKLAPAEDEWPELNQRHERLAHAQALIDAARQAASALEEGHGRGRGGEHGGMGAIAALEQAQAALQAQCGIEPQFAPLADMLDACVAQARDAAHSLHAWLRRTEPDPQALAQLDERMAQWLSLARRYRRLPEELPATLAGWRAELARLDSATDLTRLHASVAEAEAAYRAEARRVSQARRAAAPRLAQAVTGAMQHLGMAGGRFAIELPVSEPAAHGLEGVAFLVAGHAGATPRALEKVASGGELSRLALAIAVTTSRLGATGTLVFDEVDAGVGGAVAATVGQLLRQLGTDRQVLCVTHLPQVAACADHHLVVHKQSQAHGGAASTTSRVRPVTGEARVTEVARMLGGDPPSPATLAHAHEMLAGCTPPAAPPEAPAPPPPPPAPPQKSQAPA
ncbi:MAG: DNA repair protein RecN [Comamonadaceae bacterium]|nr:DNA repair protein RecN [Comamonadaceae bacterium]